MASSKLNKLAGTLIQLLISFFFVLLLFPLEWVGEGMRVRIGEWFGAFDYRPPAVVSNRVSESFLLQESDICLEDIAGWRDSRRIETIEVRESQACRVDNPYAVAAFVRGTNNVSMETLMAAGLAPDAVEKSNDYDNDGDPDEIHIRLEVVELNGASNEISEPVVQYEVAPGIKPGLWVFAPKTFGMATVNFESNDAREILRAPSPTIRIEQGDRVFVTLENTHYLPHTIHFHGVDHPFLDSSGQGNDGVPVTSELPLEPGMARTYELQPRQTGTMFYHCHVQVQVHVMMGLQGMFVVEENRPDNWLQTLNIGAGHVRSPSVASTTDYDHEYDLHFTDLDLDLNNLIQSSNDPDEVERLVNRGYDITDATSDIYTLNGRSFPYTFQESLVIVQPDELVKLRVLNGGSEGLSLHTHGHKTTATHLDGVAVLPGARVTRDVFWLSSAQRTDLELNTTNDGQHSYGSGAWLLHDHQERGITNDGLGPGGNLGAIVYQQFISSTGWPVTYGQNLAEFFDPAYYMRSLPQEGRGDPTLSTFMFLRLIALGIAFGVLLASLFSLYRMLGKN